MGSQILAVGRGPSGQDNPIRVDSSGRILAVLDPSSQIIVPGFTFAGLPSAASYAGAIARVTNVGPTGFGSLWQSNGTRWYPLNGHLNLYTLATRSSNIANSETIVAQYLIPAGMLQVSDRIRVALAMSKSGATDTGNITFRMGTAGTTADASLGSGAFLAAASRAGQIIQDFKLLSATSLQRITGNVAATQGYLGPANNVYQSATVITDASANALYLSIGINSSGATDTVNIEDVNYELLATN